MTTYSGIFIGGPMDGRTLTHDAPRWDYNKTPASLTGPVDYSYAPAAREAAMAESERGSYYYTNIAILGLTGHASGRNVGFWVEHDMTADDAMTALLTRYQEPRKRTSLLRRARNTIIMLYRLGGMQSEAEFRETRDMIDELGREVGHEG